MRWNFIEMYVFLKKHQDLLVDGKWGIEREFQRVTYDGNLALTPHPAAFGGKLVNKEITTDFSESQIELITPAFSSVEEVDLYLNNLHEKVSTELGNEYIWPLSMPPRLPEDKLIPIAKFDDSKEGQAAYLYRQGLANRYGKKMQMISGIHFNFSYGNKLINLLHKELGLSDKKQKFTDDLYFSVARNFLRFHWLLIYLFGASPSFDETYNTELMMQIEKIRKCCPQCCNDYLEYATSLRSSRYGYSNPLPDSNSVFYNSKDEYIQKIKSLMAKKSKRFAKLDAQLNDKILQKDSEFYSSIRLKQITAPGESQINALDNRGVMYAEVRILDIDPYEKAGISLKEMRFLQVFLLYCLFEESKPIDSNELKTINNNHSLVALSGRKPKLMLNSLSGQITSLVEWGEIIFSKLYLIAGLLDNEDNGNGYSLSVQEEYHKLIDISLLPSSKIQHEMISHKESFLEFGMRKSNEHKVGYTMEVI